MFMALWSLAKPFVHKAPINSSKVEVTLLPGCREFESAQDGEIIGVQRLSSELSLNPKAKEVTVKWCTSNAGPNSNMIELTYVYDKAKATLSYNRDSRPGYIYSGVTEATIHMLATSGGSCFKLTSFGCKVDEAWKRTNKPSRY
jgi:hypothetical protein